MELSCQARDKIIKGKTFSMYIKFKFTNHEMNLFFYNLSDQINEKQSCCKYREKKIMIGN